MDIDGLSVFDDTPLPAPPLKSDNSFAAALKNEDCAWSMMKSVMDASNYEESVYTR